MPHVALLRDPDPARRTAFRAAVLASFGSEPRLTVSERTVGEWWIAWAAGEHVPISWRESTARVDRERGPAGVGTLLVGRAFDGSGILDAAAVSELLADPSAARPAVGGFFFAARVEPTRLTAIADPLGLFPVYHAAEDGVIALSTSPHLIAGHPRFPLSVDVRGLIGLLLTQHPIGDRSIVAGTRRLGAGEVLEWSTMTGLHPRAGFRLPRERRTDLGEDEHVGRLEHALADALRSELSTAAAPGFLLSGGRDSRLLAGFAAEAATVGEALVMGRDGDYEVETARRVAERLGIRIRAYEPTPEAYVEAARRSARWEPLVGGISNVHAWDLGRALEPLPPVCVNGYNMDVLVGGTWFYAADHATRSTPVSVIVDWVTPWGIDRGRLRRLLRPRYADLVDEVLADLERAYLESSDDPSERAWRFVMAHGERYRVGSNAWRVCFGSWPVMPTLHVPVLEVVATADQRAIAHRRAQDRILRRRFPELARIPLVLANAELAAPLRPSWWDRIGFRLRRRLSPSPDVRARRRERRVNWRAYDFNNPGWRAIRRSAEPSRDVLADWFVMDEVARYLPGPEETPVSETFFDLMGPQVLVGLIGWGREHL